MSLKVAIHDKDRGTGNVLKCLLVCFQHLHERVQWNLLAQHLLHILIDHLDLLNFDSLRGVAAECAACSDRVVVNV